MVWAVIGSMATANMPRTIVGTTTTTGSFKRTILFYHCVVWTIVCTATTSTTVISWCIVCTTAATGKLRTISRLLGQDWVRS
jgi:hypothetical protein